MNRSWQLGTGLLLTGLAGYVDALGFVRLGGPLPGSRDVLLIFRAESPKQIETRLADDCWTRNGFLHTTRISAWDLRIGMV